MKAKLIRRLFFKTLLSALFTAFILFAAAGTVVWPAAWFFLAEFHLLAITIGLMLAKDDPALLKERLAPIRQSAQEPWDRAFVTITLFTYHAWFALIGLDAVRLRFAPLPAEFAPIGATLLFLGMAVVYRVFRENTFTACVVKIQRQRGHHVISTGPYRFVRHPMYSGAFLVFFGIPLLLGSGLGFLAALVLALSLFYRARKEEFTLINQLEGYRDYISNVRFRFIPHVW